MKTKAIGAGFECSRCGYSFTGPKGMVSAVRKEHESEPCEPAGQTEEPK